MNFALGQRISIFEYMKREVLPHIPDAQAFFEGKNENASFDDDRGEKIIKIGAEIPLLRYFYTYETPASSEELLSKFQQIEENVIKNIKELLS